MDDTILLNNYYIGLSITIVIVLAAAILLLLVRSSARRILVLAKAALTLVIQIKENTNSIWELKSTNTVAGDLLDGARAIESHAGLVARALHETNSE